MYVTLGKQIRNSETKVTQNTKFKPNITRRSRSSAHKENGDTTQSNTSDTNNENINATQVYNSYLNEQINQSHGFTIGESVNNENSELNILANGSHRDKNEQISKRDVSKKRDSEKKKQNKTTRREKKKASSPTIGHHQDLPEHITLESEPIVIHEDANAPNELTKRTILDFIIDTTSGKPTAAKARKIERNKRSRERAVRRRKGEIVSDDDEEDTLQQAKPQNSNEDKIDLEIEESSNKRARIENDALEDLDDFEHVEMDGEDQDLERLAVDVAVNNYGTNYAPQLRLNERGELVIDEDRAIITDARRSEADYNDFERVTEISGSNRYITQATYSRRAKQTGKASAARWSDEDTELFYKGLRQFGAEFSMISRLFLHRTRRDIKNKFKREERENPEEIEAALYNASSQLEIDVEGFKASSQLKDQAEGIVRRVRNLDEDGEELATRDESAGSNVVVTLRSDDGAEEGNIQNNTIEDQDEFEPAVIEGETMERVDLGTYNEDEFASDLIDYESKYRQQSSGFADEDAVLEETDVNEYEAH
jgi:hypothetical protein